MTLKTIRLELARDHDFPNGSSARGYQLKAPLTPDGHIDAAAWRQNRAACLVKRFWEGEGDETGHLRHTRGGKWAFYAVAWNVEPYLLTSEGAVQAAASAGDVTIASVHTRSSFGSRDRRGITRPDEGWCAVRGMTSATDGRTMAPRRGRVARPVPQGHPPRRRSFRLGRRVRRRQSATAAPDT